ncbi:MULTISPECIES: hypothetical protein [unclassified Pseudomonas]|uniref:hypothetical protein n=1 Tax=unclassified Pseudomonas TaxID=196821 RepID=UPI000C88DED4|nr:MULTISPECIES: hypothetical protein [unclassified Pseudomonas]PMZ85274.1 hypothetical protein C1X61_28260 [Pseudomonas sp. FW215-T2]PNA08304.1 hypothetical protein C1X62_25840 [Pseudomonas sp. FW215-R3]PNB34440.1 hypothetical protein C1X63_27230 [Pseudomonas sp. FW305-131]
MTVSNLEKYRKDLKALLHEGERVLQALLRASLGGAKWRASLKQAQWSEEKIEKLDKSLRPFKICYNHWYSEALVVVKQLLPDRYADFVKFYERPKTRKSFDVETYRIEDACQDLSSTRYGGNVIVDMSAAVPLLQQQLAILESIEKRFESSLFDIKQLVQADLFDSELDVARELLKNKFARAAGAVAGVVLEGHLKQVCDNHNLPKKSGTIAVLNDALKAAGVIELSQSRHIQFLGDIRNKCGHKNPTDPTVDEVGELIAGVDKVIKTIF